MKDIALNENLEVIIDGRNDLKLVDGRQQFEQALALRLHATFYEEAGSLNTAEAMRLVEMRAVRVAQEYDRVDSVASILVEESDDIPDSIDVTVTYLTGETFEANLL